MGTERASPGPLQTLHGRGPELARIVSLLARGARLVTLWGPPGVGKTTLARVLVSSWTGRDITLLFVGLASATTRSSIVLTIAHVLGLAPRTTEMAVVVGRIAQRLEGSPTVLVLDGIDEVLDDVRSVIDDLQSEVSDLAIVVGSRVRLGTSLEIVVPVGPLSSDDAVELLMERVAQASPSRVVPSDVATKLVAWAGGVPLAVEIAAGWVATLGARETLTALGEGRLAQSALDRALDASWTLLALEERRAFASCSVFRGRFDLAAARAVIDEDRAELRIVALVAASLLSVHETTEGVRYAMLDGVRSYASRRAAEDHLEELALRKLARHLATSPRPRADKPSSWRRLAEEREDLVRAWKHAIDNDVALALRLAVVLEPSLAAQGPPDLHLDVLDRTVAASEKEGLADLSKAHAGAVVDLLYARGRFEALRGRHVSAVAPLERGMAVADRHFDAVRGAWLRSHLVQALCAAGEDDDVEAPLARARELAEPLMDARLEATMAFASASLSRRSGRFDRALDDYRRAAAAARAADAARLEGGAWLRSGSLSLECGDLASAERSLAEARRIFELVSDTIHLARVAVFEGIVAFRRGAHALAEARLTGSLDEALLQDDVDGELEARAALVEVARARGDAVRAARRFDDLEHAARRAEAPAWRARVAQLAHAVADVEARAPIVLTLARDGRSFDLDGRTVDFGRRGPLRRILVALAELHDSAPDRALSVAEVREAGWAGERMRHESGTSRVYMAVRRLRALGLDAILRTSEAGYALDPSVVVRWRDVDAER